MFPFMQQGPIIPEEVYEMAEGIEGLERKSVEVLYQNAKSDGYFDRGRTSNLPGELFDIYEAGYMAGEWGRQIDLANGVPIEDPKNDPEPTRYETFAEAPLWMQVQHILRNHEPEIYNTAIIIGTILGGLFLIRKTFID